MTVNELTGQMPSEMLEAIRIVLKQGAKRQVENEKWALLEQYKVSIARIDELLQNDAIKYESIPF